VEDRQEPLTPRERTIVDLAGGGLSQREIAVRLAISLRTVRNDLVSAHGKLRRAGGGTGA